jgi:hypothetical protein
MMSLGAPMTCATTPGPHSRALGEQAATPTLSTPLAAPTSARGGYVGMEEAAMTAYPAESRRDHESIGRQADDHQGLPKAKDVLTLGANSTCLWPNGPPSLPPPPDSRISQSAAAGSRNRPLVGGAAAHSNSAMPLLHHQPLDLPRPQLDGCLAQDRDMGAVRGEQAAHCVGGGRSGRHERIDNIAMTIEPGIFE